jgi:hypothetical protein
VRADARVEIVIGLTTLRQRLGLGPRAFYRRPHLLHVADDHRLVRKPKNLFENGAATMTLLPRSVAQYAPWYVFATTTSARKPRSAATSGAR